ncbi:hypothetical protein ACFXI3_15920 [Amycolatopsis sp. NPDC059235]|uniref:hypothetical protein n=1 Tax=Amycolatopsis sp. NPDC059235 TaxID=3346782 RepID=UPI003671683C
MEPAPLPRDMAVWLPQDLARLGSLPRLAAAARLPVRHEAQAGQACRAIEAGPRWQGPLVSRAGLPVLLVGGMGSTPVLLAPLRALLTRLGCRVPVAPVRLGIGCGEATARAVEHALAEFAATVGDTAALVAHSRGGQFARAVAVRRSDLVRGLMERGGVQNCSLPARQFSLTGTPGPPFERYATAATGKVAACVDSFACV